MRRLLLALPLSCLLCSPPHTVAESVHGPVEHQGKTNNSMSAEPYGDREDGIIHDHDGQETIMSMTERPAHTGPHFRWTQLRPVDQNDQERAAEIAAKLRQVLEPYRDYGNAMKDGYEPFLPNVAQPHYHFINKWRGLKSAFRFNAEQPTSLLYKKTADGYELEGAMFTAPRRTGESELNERIPLSVARWHAHVNICLPPKREVETADWRKYGPNGSILTKEQCKTANGRWTPQLFGWMIHVYPFKATSAQIWSH